MKTIICPICKKQTTWENNAFRPFCSERCQMLDFGAWIDEEYAVSDARPKDFSVRETGTDDFEQSDSNIY